ncbi:MAG: methionine--tRNA ligase [Fimbriimonadaceae bacterium]
MPSKSSIVTAIPYVNSVPHIGNVLTTLSGDITARYHRMRGEDVFFVAGTDENGLKIKEAAEAAGRDPEEFVAEMAGRFQTIFKGLHIEWDEFVRTREPRHIRAAQHLFQILEDRGHIYLGKYEGWYDVSTETFFKESDLVDGKSPDGNEVRWVSEENYFFRLSAFEETLAKHIEDNPTFIVPESRRNEVISFVRQGLRDAAVSRQNPGWGIPVPGREDQVIYVWFDALINYITATGWPDPGWEDKWPPIVQWLGKDILTRFHATLWPAMLMGAGLPLPKVVAAHAWIVIGDGEKMSKSKGNVVAPLELSGKLATRSGCAPEVAVDAVRYYLCSTMPFETDWVFTQEDFDRRYNSDLANDLGNALNRSLAMSHKFAAGVVPGGEAEAEAALAIGSAKAVYEAAMEGFRLDHAVEAAWSLVRFLNKYIDTRAPWALAKAADPALPGVMRSMLLCLRACEGLVRPTMPVAADAIAAQLNLPALKLWNEIGTEGSLPAGTQLSQPQPIFPRLDTKKEQAMPDTQPAAPQPTPETSQISIDEFAKVQFKVGRVIEAIAIEGSDKLVKLDVMIGEERRQIVAGIRKSYEPLDLIGRQVVVVANLKPAMLRGVESQGMLLAADDGDGGAILLQPEKEAPEGAKVR